MAALNLHHLPKRSPAVPSLEHPSSLRATNFRCKATPNSTADISIRNEVPSYLAVAAAAVASRSPGTTKLQEKKSSADTFKNWFDEPHMIEDQKLVAKLRLLQASISDRKEMHSTIGQQRDNWNKLFQGSLRLATVSAALLAALSGALSTTNHSSLTISAGVLDIVAALVMVAVNKFQPSQLAEEQRTAVRKFGDLYHEVEATLAISPTLREDSSLFVRNLVSRFHALDQAYPLPLTPGGLPKFPKEIVPYSSGTCFDPSAPVIRVNDKQGEVNGWSRDTEEDLLRVSAYLSKDIENYLNMCRIILKANRVLAVAAPAMIFVAGVANFGNCLHLQAALLSIGAFFAGVMSHDMQLGMVFEMYRNCAGYYVEMNETIQRTLRMPVELRENGELFHQRIVHKLGRRDEFPSIPLGAATAGILF